MSRCASYFSRIDLYLDGELRGEELQVFNDHVNECPSCRRELTERRRFLEQIRVARPLYTPSAEFRAEMAGLLASPVRPAIVPARQHQVAAKPSKYRVPFWLFWLWSKPMPALITCVLAIAGIVTLWKISLTEVHANAFVDMAVETHRQQIAGRLPLEVRTSSPAEISAWFTSKLPFHFRLPNSQETVGQEQRYELRGGRLVNFKRTCAGYIAYHMQAQLISLLVTSASSSVASGGEETVARDLVFHTHRKGELQVVTWSVHNLTYALVSDINLPAGQSCGVCHGSTKQRDLIRNLRSLNKQRTIRSRLMLLSDISNSPSGAGKARSGAGEPSSSAD